MYLTFLHFLYKTQDIAEHSRAVLKLNYSIRSSSYVIIRIC